MVVDEGSIAGVKYSAVLPRSLRQRLDMGRDAVTRFVMEVGSDLPDAALVVDAGAGEGRYAEHFSRQRYHAIDLALGDASWDYSGLSAIADLHHLPLADGAIDVLVSTQTLEHLRDPRRFLEEIARVLRPGGKVFLTAPQGFKEHQEPHDYWRYTQFSLRMLCEDAGLEVDFVRPQGGYFRLLGDRIQPSYRYAFAHPSRHPWRLLLRPLYPLLKVLATIVVPLACLLFDRFDSKRQHTVGYEVGATKPEESRA